MRPSLESAAHALRPTSRGKGPDAATTRTRGRDVVAQFTADSGKPVVLITGSDGLIAGRIIKSLRSEFTLVGFDNDASTNDSIDTIVCDLTSGPSLRAGLAQLESKYGSSLASAIHLAAYYDFTGKPSPLYQSLTVEGTRRLLDELQRFDVDQFVFSSSLLVMKPSSDPATEESPTQAEWAYPQSKLDAESVIYRHRGDIPVVIHRIAGVYDEDCHSVPISQQISRIYEKQLESYFFPGDAEHGQALVHLDDLADCFRRTVSLRMQLPDEDMFLIAEPDVMSYGEIQDVVGEMLHGKEWPTIRIPKAMAKVGAWAQEKIAGPDDATFIKPWMVDLADAHYAVDIAHARQALAWNPKHRLRDTLPEMVRRLKANPRRWYEINQLPYPGDS